ncbi:SAM-dependent methyltransferase [Loktanella sp. 3ANDIMAR09]|uniref:peptide chain release factor N(5)-glutamine methyltransferase n=1 Tax=Loktanella sp. 3ANDIMAR09 TaxID=1225657 RepID=UPI0006F9C214|nr:peptide chain release factor N(5)-glutamine methyltransferase [Loktanella sp. 3ANDIMAR09]KQI68460.1 SAM-dependent methyltransferase [Loktanella sp. 3ANDIMAR09]
MTWDQVLRQATKKLTLGGIPDPARDARRLLAHILGVETARLSLIGADTAPAGLTRLFDDLIDQRSRRVPVSHLTGVRQFYGRRFAVTPDVLDPRPETEVLIEQALALPWTRVLDLGTGSGCILLTLLAERRAGTFGIGTDLSRAALAVAMRNAGDLRLGDRVQFHDGDWLDALPVSCAAFDLIVSNPPYIALDEVADLAPDVGLYEPRMALTDEGDGLGAYRAIIRAAPAHLSGGGAVLVEIGPTQAQDVSDLMTAAGLTGITVHRDLDGRDRVVFGRKLRN